MSAVARVCLAGALALSVSAAASAQESKSAALAKELSAALDAAKLDSIGAKDPAGAEQFVGALYFPGEQIAKKNYRDVYLDLSSASVAGSKSFVEDYGGDGLAAKPGDNQPFDTYEAPGGKRAVFDGDWKKQQLSEADYMKTFAAADAAYSEMLKALIAQAKK
jgi:hypothetical protein